MHFVAACVLIGRMCAGVLSCIEALRGTIQAEQRAATTFLLVLFRRILLPLQASILMVQVRSPAALVVMHWEIRPSLVTAPAPHCLTSLAAPGPTSHSRQLTCGTSQTCQPSLRHSVSC